MRWNKGALILLCGLAVSFPALAQLDMRKEGVQAFQQDKDAWRRQDSSKINVLPNMVDSLGKAAVENVVNAEQAFCYRVENRPADYDGYTIDGMAVTGFCGVINEDLRRIMATQFFASPENIDFGTSEQCIIRPKLMIRFVRGVDFTDVLVSAPCYSIAVFYAGKVKAYNFKPGGEVLDVMVNSFNAQTRDFISPALLNQLLPIGVPQTSEQQKVVRSKSEPIRNWSAAAGTETEEKAAPAAKSSNNSGSNGWNKLKR